MCMAGHTTDTELYVPVGNIQFYVLFMIDRLRLLPPPSMCSVWSSILETAVTSTWALTLVESTTSPATAGDPYRDSTLQPLKMKVHYVHAVTLLDLCIQWNPSIRNEDVPNNQDTMHPWSQLSQNRFYWEYCCMWLLSSCLFHFIRYMDMYMYLLRG